jgi:hypothetical protein
VSGDAEALAASTKVDRDVLAAATFVEAVALAAQRKNKINVLWETTQAIIALSVLWAFLSVVVVTVLRGDTTSSPQPMVIALVGLANLVTGFYFGRTNHARPTPTDTHS